MAVIFGLAAALTYGASDFIAGVLSRRFSVLQVAAVGQLAAVACTLAVAPFTSSSAPGPAAAAWAVFSGVGLAVGSLTLYRGLAAGQMAVAGPLSGVGAAALPAVAAVLLGERPSYLAVVGIGLALPAVWLVSTVERPAGAQGQTRVVAGVRDGLLAGVGFAVLFFGLGRAGYSAGLWPVVVAQGTSALLLCGTALARRTALPSTARRAGSMASVGLLGGTATVLFSLAAHTGLLTIAAVLTALYPAFTVLLARVVLAERLGRAQAAGLGLAAVAVTLIVAG